MADQTGKDYTNLLRWGIENSQTDEVATNGSTSNTDNKPAKTALDQEALRRLILGGPSDADLMRRAMAAIQDPSMSLEDKITAFDNFEQLVEQIDNANNMENMGLWQPLVDLLGSEQAELRAWAAWCCATAVSNNVKAQERLLVMNAIPTLVSQATADSSQDARRKAILALSSGVRNYQPSLDKAVESLPKEYLPPGSVDASDMEAVDTIISNLRESSVKKG